VDVAAAPAPRAGDGAVTLDDDRDGLRVAAVNAEEEGAHVVS
jgi:hypothetical protein